MIKKLYEQTLSLFYPGRCAACAAPTERPQFCEDCEKLLPRIDESCPEFIKSRDEGAVCAPFYYSGPAKAGILRLKFSGEASNARVFGHEMALAVRRCFSDINFDLVCCVPMTRRAIAERGYNQSLLLAKFTARELGLPLCARALKKNHETIPQRTLSYRERLTNVIGAFSADPRLVRGRSVLLCDDISTTGSTLAECSSALKAAGAKTVRTTCTCGGATATCGGAHATCGGANVKIGN